MFETVWQNRRDFLSNVGGAASVVALASLLRQDRAIAGPATGTHSTAESAAISAAASTSVTPSHHAARAKRVIWLFMHGGPSHVDLFDPKPDLVKYGGQPVPESFGAVMTRRNVARNPLLAPVKPFRRRGQSGLEISDFLPHIGACADDLCVVRSLHGDSVNHPQSVYQVNTGSILMGKPSVGAWVAYGLGTENANMPAFLVLPDPGGGIKGGPPAWGSGYLPASYQGVTMRAGAVPILNMRPPPRIAKTQQRRTLDLIQSLNRRHLQRHAHDDELSARVAAYELAFRMQTAAPEIVDLSQETKETKTLYGIDRPATREFGQRCLLARRMIERGVRFVQLHSGDTNGWDAHANVTKNHSLYCERTDRPIAALLRDLKRRGLLDETLVIWGGEFGRMPMSEQGQGRDHNPWGYSVWLAGAGIRGGRAYGATDAIGLRAQEQKVSIRNFHATILQLLGLDHELLSYFHNGLEQRLTGPQEAEFVHEILG